PIRSAKAIKTRQIEGNSPETATTVFVSPQPTDSFQHVDYSHSFSQPVEAVEGGSATLQCRLDPPINLSSRTVEWNRGHTLYVHVYRSRRDDPDSQMLQYRDRTTLNHGDLTRGVSTLTISNVSLSDNGSYEVYLPQLEVRCLTHLTVVKEEQSKRKDSGTPAPPAEGDPAAEQRNHVLCVLIPVAFVAVVIAVWILVERGVIQDGEAQRRKDRQTETAGNECENTNLNTDAETGDLQRRERTQHVPAYHPNPGASCSAYQLTEEEQVQRIGLIHHLPHGIFNPGSDPTDKKVKERL
ncbi:hypothetical protein JOQ06_013471, partial [Pogonophryne albipinna]